MRWLLAACVLWSAACQESDAPPAAARPAAKRRGNPYATDLAALAEGRKLYLAYGCAGCHGVGGGGGMGRPLLDDEWRFGSDDATLFKLVRGEIPQQTMPSVIGRALGDEQIWKILAFVRALYQGDPAKIDWVPPPPGAAEQAAAIAVTGGADPVAAGKEIFTGHCAPCHGPAGKGDGPAGVSLVPRPRDLSDGAYLGKLDDRYLFEIVSRGGAAFGKSQQMPPAGLDGQELRSVIAYVRTLSHVASP